MHKICNVALHFKGLVVTLNIMHTVYNLRHNSTIIAITIGFIFENACVGNVKPSLLRLPHGLKELFDSPSVRMDTRIQSCGSIPRTAGICNTARLLSVVEEVSVARVLLPARGLLLSAGSDMLKESTKTFKETSCINIEYYRIMS